MCNEESRSKVESPGLTRIEDKKHEPGKGAWFAFMIEGKPVAHYVLDFNIFTGEFITACGKSLSLFLHVHSRDAINTCNECYYISLDE